MIEYETVKIHVIKKVRLRSEGRWPFALLKRENST
jgi:hypothetical protein